MFTIARGALRLFVRHWPVLLAWYLFGHLTHHFLVSIAATVGSVSALGGLLVLPLAALARLTGFVGMFLALRPSLHGFEEMSREVSGSGVGYVALLAGDRRERMLGRPLRASREFVQVLSATVLPFFAFYAAWRYLEDDLASYVAQAFTMVDFGEDLGNVILNAGTSPLTVGVVLAAFVARIALNRFSARLPEWTRLASVYFEAVWVFLAANVLVNLVDGVPAWLESRTLVVWSTERLAELRALVPPLGWLSDAAVWLVGELGALVFLPFAWLAIAAVLYGRAIALHAAATTRPERTPRARGTSRPTLSWVRGEIAAYAAALRLQIAPVVASARVVAGAGLAPFGVFVLLYTIVDGLSSWLTLAATRLLGPHEFAWWLGIEFVLSLGVLAIAEPLRVVVVAASYDYCLQLLDARQDAEKRITAQERVEAVAGLSEPAAATARSSEASCDSRAEGRGPTLRSRASES